MRQPLMTAGVGLALGCNPWASVVFFGAYLCSDQLHASRGWISESSQSGQGCEARTRGLLIPNQALNQPSSSL